MQVDSITQNEGRLQSERASDEGLLMERGFHVFVHHNSDSVHLKLFGVFDDLSALELNGLIDRYAGNVNKIFVHTEALKQVLPTGKAAFHKRLMPGIDNLVFTGQLAAEFMTEMEAPADQPGLWAALR